jgi:hypothetical protein
LLFFLFPLFSFSFKNHTKTTDKMEPIQANPLPINKDYFVNSHAAMDEWHYEMRREIQEIIVSCLFFTCAI